MKIIIETDDLELFEMHSGETDHREWGKHISSWLYPGDAVFIIDGDTAIALIEAMKGT